MVTATVATATTSLKGWMRRSSASTAITRMLMVLARLVRADAAVQRDRTADGEGEESGGSRSRAADCGGLQRQGTRKRGTWETRADLVSGHRRRGGQQRQTAAADSATAACWKMGTRESCIAPVKFGRPLLSPTRPIQHSRKGAFKRTKTQHAGLGTQSCMQARHTSCGRLASCVRYRGGVGNCVQWQAVVVNGGQWCNESQPGTCEKQSMCSRLGRWGSRSMLWGPEARRRTSCADAPSSFAACRRRKATVRIDKGHCLSRWHGLLRQGESQRRQWIL